MNIKVFQNRKVEKDYFYSEGTQNENNITVLTFEVPLGYEDFSKRIVFITEDGNFWDYIPENEYEIKNNITKYETIEAYLWLTKDDQDFRSQKFELNFYENENADDLVPTEEEIDGFKTLVAELDLKIAEVEELKVEIGDFREALNSKASKKELKEVDDKFDNYYPKTETYNKTEIDNKISVIPKFNRIVVDELPTENIQEDAIYLIPSQGDTNDLYREYIYINNKWELIGIQKGDLSNIYTKQEVDEIVKEIQETNEYQSEIIDQFKNEFKQITVSGDSIYIPNAAELPMELIPYGEPVQTVIEEELGNTVEGESVVVADGDVEKEVKATVNGNSYQYSTEGYNELKVDETNWELTDNGIKGLGKAGTSTGVSLSAVDINLKANTTYYLNFVLLSRPTNSVSFSTSIDKVANDSISFLGIEKTTNFTIGKVVTKTYTPTKDETLKVIMWGNANSEIFEFQCWITTDSTKTKYEPYTNGASPNIEYPQEVEVVEGVNELQIDKEYWELTDNGIKNLYKNSSVLLGKEINLKANITYYINFVLLSRPTVSTTFVAYIDNVSNDSISAINIEVESRFTIGKVVTKSYTPTKDEVLTFKMWGNENGETFEFQYWVTTVPNAPYLPYGHIGLVQRGKNVFSIDKALLYDTPSITGVIEGNSISMSGNGTWGNYALLFENPKENTDVSISADFLESVIAGKKGISIYGKNQLNKDANDLVVLKSVMVDVALNTKTRIENTANTGTYKYIYVRFWNNATATTLSTRTNCTVDNIQMELGEPTPYEPYIEPILKPINLEGNSLAKVGEIADLLNIWVDGSVSIEKKIDKDIYNGSKKWGKSSNTSNTIFYLQNTQRAMSDIIAICNYFKAKRVWDKDIVGIELYDTVNIRVGLGLNSPITTADEFNNWLAEHNLEVWYPLREEHYETIELPSIEPITLFEGTNVFELVTNLGTTMALTYDYVTPSPSIDRPSEILTVKGSYDTEKDNQNLYNYRDTSDVSSSGVTVDDEGWITLSGDNTNGTTTKFINYFCKKMNSIKPSTNYNIVSEIKSVNGTASIVFTSVDKGTGEFGWWGYNLSQLTSNSIKNAIRISRENNTSNVGIRTYLQLSAGQSGSITFRISCLEDTSITADTFKYEPHKSTTLPLTLTKELLGEIVTLTEEEAKQLNLDGAGKYKRTDYGRLTNISTMDKYIVPNVEQGFYMKILNINNDNANLLMKSNKQKLNTYYGINWKKYDGNSFGLLYPQVNPKAVYFNKLMENKTIGEVKKWWNDNGIELIYPLETPTYEKIADETELAQLSAYDKQIAFFGVNNINTFPTDDLEKAPLKIHATYSKSNKLTIQSLEDRLASLESQVTNLQDNQI